MDFFSVLALLGGLAIFLYGMNLMGDGLAKVAGGKLERILETLTSSPIRAVLLGMGVTAVIQSSSATTVMVVGFVKLGNHETFPGSGNYHGCKYRYHSNILDLKSYRNPSSD